MAHIGEPAIRSKRGASPCQLERARADFVEQAGSGEEAENSVERRACVNCFAASSLQFRGPAGEQIREFGALQRRILLEKCGSRRSV